MIPAAIILLILATICFAGALWQGERLRRLASKRSRTKALRRAIWDASRFRWLLCIAGIICMLPAIILLAAGLSQIPPNISAGTSSTSSSSVSDFSAITEPSAVTEPSTEPTQPVISPPTFVPEITWMTFPNGRELESDIYFVYSCDTDTFTTTSGSLSEKVYPASVTKLFTSYVALQILPEDEVIRIGDAVSLVNEGSSIAELYEGHRLTPENLVTAMLLPSGNDAAYAIAQAAGKILAGTNDISAQEAVDTFVAEMNRKAQELGLTGTHFANPDGWHDENHYTCVADLAQIAKLALADPIISRCTQKVNAEVPVSSSKTRSWSNTNYLIHPESDYYCPYAVGLKTGYTKAAQNCLLSAFSWEGSTWIIGTFHSETRSGRYLDTLYLLNSTLESLQ